MSSPHAIVAMATANMGQASGLEAGAKVLLELANHNRRVVGTGELKVAAAALQEAAAKLRADAKKALRPFTQSNVQ